MKKIKVLKNFSCNGVRKKVGEFLSEEEKEMIGKDFGKDLFHNDFLQGAGSDQDEDSDENDQDLDQDEDQDQDEDSDDEIDLSEMDKKELLDHAKSLGLNPHHNSGEEKIREMILEKSKA